MNSILANEIMEFSENRYMIVRKENSLDEDFELPMYCTEAIKKCFNCIYCICICTMLNK